MVKSTRTGKRVTESQAILEGLCSDGGLYIFEKFPQIDLDKIYNMTYKELSIYILSELLEDYTTEEITEAINNAYDDKFELTEIVDVKHYHCVSMVELFYGPTKAFKDMALTVLPELQRIAKKKNNIKENTIILTATSGDTGGATLSGFKDVPGMKTVIFYPNKGVSEVQERQMLSYASKDAKVIAYDGNFDDTQNLVKEKFNEYPKLSSANSINIGRLAPQIIYYFYGYIQMVKAGKLEFKDSINVVVPTGNFGNILASYIAYKMGLPINNFVCASNQNKVLTDFFNTGKYDIKRTFYRTYSPSMDILISSNLERLLYLLGEDTTKLMKDLKEKQEFTVSEEVFKKMKCFKAGFATDQETLNILHHFSEHHKYIIDPHTAVAVKVFKDYKQKINDKRTMIISTASPYKFPDAVTKAHNYLGLTLESKLNFIKEFSGVEIPKKFLSFKTNDKVIWNKENKDRLFKKLMEELEYDKN